MWIQQVFVACLCVLLELQQITAVVNNGQQKIVELPSVNATTTIGTTTNDSSTTSTSSNISSVTDSVAESSEQDAHRREAPLGLSDSYGAPIPSNAYGIPLQDSYVPAVHNNIGLPVPVYGVPDGPSNNLVYPAPPPDIPPPIQNLPNIYGPPKDIYGPPAISLPPPKYGPPQIFSRPLKPFNLPNFNIPKPIYGSPPPLGVPPRQQYGPPQKPIYFPPKLPKPSYGPPFKLPKPNYGPPKPLYVPNKPLGTYGPPTGYFNTPKEVYGPPKNLLFTPAKGSFGLSPAAQYGPPEPIPHGPPHPGAPAPPTPPDIKYDGWQPIPGLVSRPPSGTYGVPQGQLHGTNDLQFNTDFIPPPSGGHGIGGSYKGSSGLSDSYGAPLNTVTGSGGIINTSGDDHRGSGGVSLSLGGGFGNHGGSSLGIGGGFGGHGGTGFGIGGGSGGHSFGSSFGGGSSHHSGGSSFGSGSSHHSGGSSFGSGSSHHSGSASFGSGSSHHSGGSSFGGGSSHHSAGSSFGSHGGSAFAIGGGSGSSFGGHGSFGSSGGNGLSVIKSIGYEILPGGGIQNFGNGGSFGDSYTSPPLNSYSPNGPYAAAHSYSANSLASLPLLDSFASNLASSFETTLLGSSNGFGQDLTSGIGLIPPSGVYGVPSSGGKYGTPLLNPPHNYNGPALNINPPKQPVVFREPVPPGLIESIGNSVAQKDARGIIDSAHANNFAGPAYVPPPVPDIVKPVNEEEPSGPSNLYSLPNKSPISFQSYVHGSSSSGLSNDFSGSFNFNGANTAALTSYTAPLGTIDGSYGLPQTSGLSAGLTLPHAGSDHLGSNALASSQSYAVTNFAPSHSGNYATPYFSNYQSGIHDCSQKSQPVPSLSFGVPAANSYTASLASLNTNIAGAYQGPPPALNYNAPDLQSAHSQSTDSVSDASSNSLEEEKQLDINGKSLAQNFGPGSELLKSQSIDLNNIPLQGALGSYTLQIQSANGLGGGGAGNTATIPHDQVLNDGLLQSILNAIEQPQHNTAAILGQPLLHLQQIPPQFQPNGQPIQHIIPSGTGQGYGALQDSEAQNSVTKNIVVTPPPLQTPVGVEDESEPVATEQPEGDKDANIPLIDNNEIALYFSNNAESASQEKEGVDSSQQNKNVEGSDDRNGQQYGSYVSFKNRNSSFAYGDLRPINGTLVEDIKSPKEKT